MSTHPLIVSDDDLDDIGGVDEFAYFLPKGIEDDADDTFNLARSPIHDNLRANTNSTINPVAAVPSSSSTHLPLVDDFNFNSSGGSGVGGVLPSGPTTWHGPSSTSPPFRPTSRSNSTESLLAAYQLYAQQPHAHTAAATSSPYVNYPTPSPPPTHNGAYPIASLSSPVNETNSNFNNFFSSMYQSTLMMPHPSSSAPSALIGGSSHYTKAPPGLIYDDSIRMDDKSPPMSLEMSSTPSIPPSSSSSFPSSHPPSRRRPLPHYSSVTIMNRPPSEEAESLTATVITQPKTTVVTTAVTVPSAANANPHSGSTNMASVLSANSWAATHQTTNTNYEPKNTYVKSVVASTKTEKWPKVKSTATVPTASTNHPNNASSTTAPAVAVAVPASSPPTAEEKVEKIEPKKFNVAHTKQGYNKSVIPPKRAGPPIATIRHIESEEPVPLTASDIAGLNAHLRKAATHLAYQQTTAPHHSNHSTTHSSHSSAPSSSSSTSSSSPAVVVQSKRSHRHHHHHMDHSKYQPGPKAIPNDNVFDFLGEADPDEILDEDERVGKRKGRKSQSRSTNKLNDDTTDSQSVSEDDTNTTKEDNSDRDEDDDGDEDDSAEEAVSPADSATVDDSDESDADETSDPEDEDEDDSNDTNIVTPVISGDSSDDADSDDDDDSNGLVSSTPSRVASPPISPTTGRPIPPILKSTLSPSAGSHTRRVSFMQAPTKKQLAEQKRAIAAPATIAVSLPESVSTTDDIIAPAPSSIVESVTGLKKRNKGGKDKKGTKLANQNTQSKPSKNVDEKHGEDEDDEDSVDTPVKLPTQAPSTPFQAVTLFFVTFFLQLVTLSRSLGQRCAQWCSRKVGSHLDSATDAMFIFAHIHGRAFHVIIADHQMAFCFTFLYFFPYLVHHMLYWAPTWAAPCLWYAFLMQVFCSSQGSPLLVGSFRILLPLFFVTEGVSHHTLLLELNGAERLVIAFVLSSFKTQEYYRPLFLFALGLQILVSLLYGNHWLIQWSLLIVSLLVIHQPDPSLPPLLVTPTSLKSALQAVNPELLAELAPSSTTPSAASTANPSSTTGAGSSSSSSWLHTMFGTSGMAAFNRRMRAKASAQKARRTGRMG